MKEENPLLDKSYLFALRIVKLHQYFVEQRKEYVLSKQILRSGTSVGANIEEANQAESKPDFIHKLSVSNKEAHETFFWLRLLRDAELLEPRIAESLLTDCDELIRLLTASIKSSKRNQTLRFFSTVVAFLALLGGLYFILNSPFSILH